MRLTLRFAKPRGPWHVGHMRALEPDDPTSLHEGAYTLLGILGEGSMGRTYLAEGEAGRVAIKQLYPSRLATAKDLELFVREAAVLQKLSHPHIPRYIDAFDEGEGEGTRYHLVQEWVDGETLRARMAQGVRWSEADVVPLMRSLLRILAYMHGLEPTVVHRDLKPDNVILRASDNEPTLVDFGAVREVVRLTMGGGSTIIGIYGYMPPEQLMGRSLPASDLYSLGITVLELLTRQTPQDLHGDDARRLVAECNVSEGLRRVLERLCAPALADRYETAEQVLRDLEALQAGSALVHAGSIEQAMRVRAEQEERALKKASTPGIVHLGYMALIGIITVGALAGIGVVFNMIASGFEGAFVGAVGVSGVGMMITLALLTLRYTHDAWGPPTSKWARTRGTIQKHTLSHYDEFGNALREPIWRVHYGFKTPRGEFTDSILLKDEQALSRYPVGREFDVYFQQGKPEWHEIQDFVHDPDNNMGRLFDPAVLHTPE